MDLEDELTEAKFIGGESDSAYAERVRDWKNAIAMCNKEKHIFAQTIGKTKKTLVALSKKDTVGKALSDIDDDLASRASSYISHVDKYVASGDEAKSHGIKDMSAKALKAYHAAEKHVTAAKGKAYVKKAMLLQTGQ